MSGIDIRSKPDVTVLLLCYNEEQALGQVIAAIHKALGGTRFACEILLVDDGSTDKSAAIAAELGCRVTSHPARRGAGAALKTGVSQALGGIVVMLDADGTYTPADIPKMLEFFPDYDQVNGKRTSEQGDLPLLRSPVKWLVRAFASLLAGRVIPDLQTGLKAFKRDILLEYLWIIPDKFSHCPLITLAFMQKGCRIKYIPTEYHKRIGGASKFHPVLDTAYVLWSICRFMLHYNPWRLVGVAALLLTVFALLAMLVVHVVWG